MTKKTFNVQIPTHIVRDNRLSASEFLLLAKLIQLYYIQPQGEKVLNISFSHKEIMYLLNFRDNNTFKKHLKGLSQKLYITNTVLNFPRKGNIEIVISKDVIPELMEKEMPFTQLPYYVLNKDIVNVLSATGIRLLYYYKSYINTRSAKQYSYPSIETTSNHLGITQKTVIKYNALMEKLRFIRVEKHELKSTGEYLVLGSGNEREDFTKFHNHYILKLENVEKYKQRS